MDNQQEPPVLSPEPGAVIIERLDGGDFLIVGGVESPARVRATEWAEARVIAGFRRATRADPVWFRDGQNGTLLRLDVETGLLVP